MTDKLDKIQNVLEVLNGDVRRGQAELQKDITIIKDDLATLQNDVAGTKNDVAGIKRELKELRDDVAGIRHELKELQDDVAGIKHVLGKLGEVITQAFPGFAQGSGPGLGQGGIGL